MLVGHELSAFSYRIRNLRSKQADCPQRVVIARNHVIYFAGIAIGVYDRDYRNAEFARLAHRDLLFVRVDDEDRVWQAAHILDAGQVCLQMFALALQLDDFFLGQQLVTAIRGHLVEFFQTLY